MSAGDDQRRDALAVARVRKAGRTERRAKIRAQRSLRASAYVAAAVLLENDVSVATVPIGEFLDWVVRLQAQVLLRWLRHEEITWGRLVGELTDRQRAALAERLQAC